MKIAIFGIGYVGLVTGVCLANKGNNVIFVDTDDNKINMLSKGQISIYEPNLSELLVKNKDKLLFTTDPKKAIENSYLIFIAVGTPSDSTGNANMKYIFDVTKTIGKFINMEKIIIVKSTVPVGSISSIKQIILEELQQRKVNISFDVISNPEFLREGHGVYDFNNPERVVIGTDNDNTKKVMWDLYTPFIKNSSTLLFMNIQTAELTKYAANAMLATKISLMNEIANLAEIFDANILDIKNALGLDSRIGDQFINPGCGYGGSCFPKDIKALINLGNKVGYETILLKAVDTVNDKQKERFFSKIYNYFQKNLQNKIIAIWGLSFKPDTNDIRESIGCFLINVLLEHGAIIKAFDPKAMNEVKKIYNNNTKLFLCDTKEECLNDADILVISTEWEEFSNVNLELIGNKLKNKVIIDGRNIFNYEKLKILQFKYYGIGYGDKSIV